MARTLEERMSVIKWLGGLIGHIGADIELDGNETYIYQEVKKIVNQPLSENVIDPDSELKRRIRESALNNEPVNTRSLPDRTRLLWEQIKIAVGNSTPKDASTERHNKFKQSVYEAIVKRNKGITRGTLYRSASNCDLKEFRPIKESELLDVIDELLADGEICETKDRRLHAVKQDKLF